MILYNALSLSYSPRGTALFAGPGMKCWQFIPCSGCCLGPLLVPGAATKLCFGGGDAFAPESGVEAGGREGVKRVLHPVIDGGGQGQRSDAEAQRSRQRQRFEIGRGPRDFFQALSSSATGSDGAPRADTAAGRENFVIAGKGAGAGFAAVRRPKLVALMPRLFFLRCNAAIA